MKPKTNRAAAPYIAQGIDACQTPAYAVDPLLPHLKPGWSIWEPACGEMYLAKKLEETHHVVATDILTGHNFFDFGPTMPWDVLVTNPPFSVKYPWLKRCYTLGKPFALLLPVDVLGAVSGQILFKRHGVEIIFLDHRVNFKMPEKGWESSAQFPVAWFTWKLGIGQPMTFAEIKPTKPVSDAQLSLFEVKNA